MVKINYKNDIANKIVDKMSDLKQAYFLNDSRKICIIEGSLKDEELIKWFLSEDAECEVQYADDDDKDKDAIVSDIIYDMQREMSHISINKNIEFITDMQEFDNCRFCSVEKFIEDVVTIIFGKPDLFKKQAKILTLAVTEEGYGVNDLTNDDKFTIKRHLERFCRNHQYRTLNVAKFFKILKNFWDDNKEGSN